ncbi:MAG: YbaK/EbsC family protein [Ignavibacteria bacterium]|nr:YbaK/EbsC family protein [Ignavibacteria bacterium]
MILKQLVEFLDSNKARYVVVTHSPAFTAQDVAQSAHIPGKEVAKTVIVWMDGTMAMAVLPASQMIDFNLLKQVTGAKNVELASESEFKDRFPECEVGAMPPFGNLFNMRVFAASSLAEDKEIAFNAGSHRELLKMAYADFERLVKPQIGSFTFKRKTQGDNPAAIA